MSARQANLVTSDGVTVQLSHMDKVFFPDDDLRKGDLIDYYRMVAPRMLPYLRDRPVVMARYPDGVSGEAILQKNVSRYFPDWVKRVEVERIGRGGAVCQVVCDRPETLIYLANQACIELHVLLSRVAALYRPDQVVFDLDPPAEDGFDDARRCALDLRRLLEEDLGLTTYVKTTGGKGLHVHVPLRADEGFDPVRDFARAVAELMIRDAPDRLTLQQRVDQRGNRIYLDVQRNGYAQMAVAPYSVRARRAAPVATPLQWAEVEDAGLNPRRFTMRTMGERLATTQDPWAGMSRHRRGLAAARRRLKSL
ncbi:MAG TPA: non-homologous end-joining DNA ligase [Trebonia sp.]|jgi:bifunctional non-homologous end joining protein LigD